MSLRAAARSFAFWAAAFAFGAAFAQAPVVTSVSVPAPGTYGAAQALDFTVNFSAAVEVDVAGGVPSLGVIIGSAGKSAGYASGSGSSSLVFRYTVAVGDFDSNGVAVGVLALGGSAIRDAGTGTMNAVTTLNGVGSTAGVLVDAVPVISTPPSLAFGSVAVGASTTLQFAVSNTGTVNLEVAAIALEGSGANHFRIVSNGCATLAPGGSCQVSIAFEPSAIGTFNAALVFYSDDPFQPARTVNLTGAAIAADAFPDFLTFNPQTGVPRNSVRTSNTVTLTGFNVPLPITVSGGEYSIGCNGTFTAAAGTVSAGQTLCLRHTSSSSLHQQVATSVQVGQSGASFSSTTEGVAITVQFLNSGAVTAPGFTCTGFGFCTDTVELGTVRTYTAQVPEPGLVAGWTGCDSVNGASCTVTASFDRTISPIVRSISTINFVLGGFQEIPYVATTAAGTGVATYHPVTRQLTLNISLSGLAGTETGAFLRGPAFRGAEGPVIATLSPGNTKSDTVTLTVSQETMLFNGQLYVNVHTTARPEGEIRGQVDSGGAPTTYVVSVAREGTGQGTVTATTEAGEVIACGTDCSATVPSNKQVSLTATPAAGSSFSGWSGSCAGLAPQCTFNLFNHAGIVATFTSSAPPNPPRLGNISTRMQVLTGNDVMIGGFVIGGSGTKRVAIVATGPSLAAFGITNPLANPTLRLVRSSDQATLATNDDWQTAANQAELTAAGLAPSNALEAAILTDLAPGAYSAIVEGAGGGTGVAVVGVYEVDHPEIPLDNISTRGRVLTGNDVMIGGFVISGSAPQTVAIVATGPSLAAFGITSPLANPTLRLVRSSDQAVLATNDDWQAASNAADITAAGVAPSNALESAILVTLPPGAYSAIVEGVGGGTGVAVIGVYKVN